MHHVAFEVASVAAAACKVDAVPVASDFVVRAEGHDVEVPFDVVGAVAGAEAGHKGLQIEALAPVRPVEAPYVAEREAVASGPADRGQVRELVQLADSYLASKGRRWGLDSSVLVQSFQSHMICNRAKTRLQVPPL